MRRRHHSSPVMRPGLAMLRRLHTFGPASSAFASCSATTSCIGDVGCMLFSQKYWSTGTPHVTLKVSAAGVPLSICYIPRRRPGSAGALLTFDTPHRNP